MSATTAKKPRDVVHDIFYEASKCITNDEYWKTFFVDLSKNKLARKIHIDGRHVTHNSKRMRFTYCYENKTPEDVAIELRKIISNTMCIYSDVDMSNEQEGLALIVGEFKEAKTEDDWKKFKNKKMKDQMITNYVLSLKTQHNLNWTAARQVYNCVTSALYVYRTHKSQDITMLNGNIDSIEDLEMVGTVMVNRRALDDTSAQEVEDSKKKLNLDKEWTRVCNAITKKAKQLLCDENDESLGIKKKSAKKSKKATTDAADVGVSSYNSTKSLDANEACEANEQEYEDADNPDEQVDDDTEPEEEVVQAPEENSSSDVEED